MLGMPSERTQLTLAVEVRRPSRTSVTILMLYLHSPLRFGPKDRFRGKNAEKEFFLKKERNNRREHCRDLPTLIYAAAYSCGNSAPGLQDGASNLGSLESRAVTNCPNSMRTTGCLHETLNNAVRPTPDLYDLSWLVAL